MDNSIIEENMGLLEITRAVRRHPNMAPPARLILLTLADIARGGTTEDPPRFSPSLRILTDETGLSASSVKSHLAALEERGWIQRVRPAATQQRHGARTRYRLTSPEHQS